MPLTPIQLNTLADVLPITAKWLGVADANFPEGGQIAAGAPYTLTQIKRLIVQADYEICLKIVENLEHPFRTKFVTEETDWLADGALVPAHLGSHSRVLLKPADETNESGEDGEDDLSPEEENADESRIVLGRQRDFSRLKRIKTNREVYGSPNDLYSIFAGRIYYSNETYLGKLDIPSVVFDVNLANLQSPLAYFWAVVAGAITTAAAKGFPIEHRRYWSNFYLNAEAAITGGATAIPEPEQLERLAA